MRKYLFIGFVTVAVGCVGAYGLFLKQSTGVRVEETPENEVQRFTKIEKDDGNAEASDLIEPLVVDRGTPLSQIQIRPRSDDQPMARAELTPGVTQPRRPGTPQRMPYADEKELFFLPFDPIQWILESPWPRLDLFEEPAEPDAAEEAEPKQIELPLMIPHHHHPHCPHMGNCPAPSLPYRMGTRN